MDVHLEICVHCSARRSELGGLRQLTQSPHRWWLYLRKYVRNQKSVNVLIRVNLTHGMICAQIRGFTVVNISSAPKNNFWGSES